MHLLISLYHQYFTLSGVYSSLIQVYFILIIYLVVDNTDGIGSAAAEAVLVGVCLIKELQSLFNFVQWFYYIICVIIYLFFFVLTVLALKVETLYQWQMMTLKKESISLFLH